MQLRKAAILGPLEAKLLLTNPQLLQEYCYFSSRGTCGFWSFAVVLNLFIGCLEALVSYCSVDFSELAVCFSLWLQEAENGNCNDCQISIADIPEVLLLFCWNLPEQA